jgi:UDP-N-acetylmuramoyl-L-alanyl-D-glutamate--2,6-diaminopimelate ligase
VAQPVPRPQPRPLALGALFGGLGLATDEPQVQVTGMTLNSRQVVPGDLFAAVPGENAHGAEFAGDAVAAGAVAVLTDAAGAARLAGLTVPVVIAGSPRSLLGEAAAQVYGRPADDLLVLGVTGTNGKTTTTWLLDAALRGSGHRTGLIGTVETRIGDDALTSVRTTPEAPELHALLGLMRDRGVAAVSLEISSHALALGRVDGLRVDVAGFTQLGRDHLDLHGDDEAYHRAKARLFTPQHAVSGVVTVDDPAGRRVAAEASVPVVTLGVRHPAEATVTSSLARPSGGYDVTLRLPEEPPGKTFDLHFTVRLPGAFNVANAALAATMLVRAGIDPDAVAAGLSSCAGVPGRMEPVSVGQPFLAVVDYAHTPDALATALAALRKAAGRLTVVFGCGGDRDAAKRELMGAVASAGADVVVVTDDNPRSEQPAAIRQAVLTGAAAGPAEVHEIGDRADAIRWAVARAGKGDVVLVAGKGHETGQEVAGTSYPFDDRSQLRAALAGRGFEDTPDGGVRRAPPTPEDRR